MADAKIEDWQHHLETKTRTASRDDAGVGRLVVPALTVLAHFDPSRIGEVAWLADLAQGRSVELSRREPLFQTPKGGAVRPLAEPRLSRRPLRFSPRPEGLLIDPSESSTPVEIDGEPLDGSRTLSMEEVERGVVLLLGRRVTLLLRAASPSVRYPPRFGLVGESPAMLRLRSDIESVADLDFPVLLRGESGTGKELVARAIQSGGPRRDAPYFSLNMGALPPNLAASELFGAAKGAYSGADRSRQGYFRRADGGTLFLDEIGEAPPEVQGLLLRALESGEVQPLGEETTYRVDVRIVAATDADLEEGIRRDSFKAALLHRLRSYEIVLPTLRDRREDLGRLFCHFLGQELEHLGMGDRLRNRGPYEPPFVPAQLLAEMALHSWPGNVRELRNAVRQVCVGSRNDDRLRLEIWREQVGTSRPAMPGSGIFGEEASPSNEAETRELDTNPPAPSSADEPTPTIPATRRSRYRDPSDVGDEELLLALRGERWNLKTAAERLGISRGSLYVRIEGHPGIRKASDLERAEIEKAIERVGESIDELVVELEVSKQGLKRRMTDLHI